MQQIGIGQRTMASLRNKRVARDQRVETVFLLLREQLARQTNRAKDIGSECMACARKRMAQESVIGRCAR